MNAEQIDYSVETDAEAPPPVFNGAALREAREQQNLDIKDVSTAIRFSPQQIEALEAGDFAKLPEMVFVRGFVRNYAKLLRIDAEPLLAALPKVGHDAPPEMERVYGRGLVVLQQPRKFRTAGVIISAFLVVALSVFVFIGMYGRLPPPQKQTTEWVIEPVDMTDALTSTENAQLAATPAVPASSPALAPAPVVRRVQPVAPVAPVEPPQAPVVLSSLPPAPVPELAPEPAPLPETP
ncbi:MAG: helix-turn-helix domain-containing protein [Methylobacillus sp.]|jgi:cytoskeleton protein RodZ|nr:helix-turn-helix domain-containing protein [Methylobacillus sp.]